MPNNFSYILCGEEKTGRLVIYDRAKLYQLHKDNEEPVLPIRHLDAHKEGSSITSLDTEDNLLVTGGTDGAANLWNLSTGKLLSLLSQGSSMVYQVRLDRGRIVTTAGSKVTVQDTEGVLTHLLEGHTREVLCLDIRGDMVVSGGMDKSVMVYRLGPQGTFKVVHTLTEHKLKVRCVKMHENLLVSGSWDRTARIWDLNTGECLRVLEHEMQVEPDYNKSIYSPEYYQLFR